jgi:hypothetical protein
MNGYAYISEREFDDAWGATTKSNGELWTYIEVVSLPINCIWTVYEDGSIDNDGYSDNNWYTTPGIIPAYALGYLVTKRLWNETTHDAIWYLDDESARAERRELMQED